MVLKLTFPDSSHTQQFSLSSQQHIVDTVEDSVLRTEMNEWVLISTCKQLVWSTRIGQNMSIWILCLILDPSRIRPRCGLIKLVCSTFQSWRCITVFMTTRRNVYWFSDVLLYLINKVPITDVGHPFVFQNTEDPGHIAHGWEDRYSVRPHPSETFLHDFFPWNALFESYPVSDSDTVYPWIRMWCHPI